MVDEALNLNACEESGESFERRILKLQQQLAAVTKERDALKADLAELKSHTYCALEVAKLLRREHAAVVRIIKTLQPIEPDIHLAIGFETFRLLALRKLARRRK